MDHPKCDQDKKQHMNFNDHENPESKAGVFSRLFFWFVIPLLRVGYRCNLEEKDLHHCLPEDESRALSKIMEREWLKEKTLGQKSLSHLLRRMFGLKFMLLGIGLFIENAVALAQPLFMGGLIRYFELGSGAVSTNRKYVCAAGVAGCSIIYTLLHHPYFYALQKIGVKVRVGTSALVFRKALRVSSSSIQKVSVGHIVNLLSNDVARFDLFVIFFHHIWVGPFTILGSLYLLWQTLGISCFAGFAMILLLIPVQSVFSWLMGRYRAEIAVKSDKRLGIMNQILNGIRVIKMYAWEDPFAKMTFRARQNEITSLRKAALSEGVIMALYYATYHLVILCALAAYSLSGHEMSAEKVFVAVALFNVCRISLTLYLPYAIRHIFEIRITLRRLQEFLLLDEKTNYLRNKIDASGRVRLGNFSAKWDAEQMKNTIRGINLNADAGKLVMIIGPVGAGKSSVLSSIMGELVPSGGTIQVTGRMAYSAQEAWIFSGTIRDNILFGATYDKATYERVVQVCALQRDLELLPNADQTLVGDRGVALSGGQKARINLARAVYRNANIYLLDDPLSAVDPAVSRHLFQECIQTHLAGKVRVLVTHQLQYLRHADQIIVLKNGICAASGTLEELQILGEEFTTIIQETKASIDQNQHPGPKRVENGPRRLLARFTSSEAVENFVEENQSSQNIKPEKSISFEEDQSLGTVSWSVYYRFMSRMAPHPILVVPLLLFTVFVQCVYNLCDWWLKTWVNQVANERKRLNTSNATQEIYSSSFTSSDYLHIYVALILGLVTISVLRTTWFRYACTVASLKLHNTMFNGVLGTSIQFFDRNPTGRILNRFSKDVAVMDEQIGSSFFDFLQGILNFLSVLIVVGILNPIIFVPTLPLLGLFTLVRHVYVRTSRQIKRLEATTRSPVFSHISASINGLTTIRAFGAEAQTLNLFYHHIDIHTSAFNWLLSTTRWLAVVIDWLSSVYVAFVAFLSVGEIGGPMSAGNVGLSLFYSISLVGTLQWFLRQSAEVENAMVSVERILSYSYLSPEPEPDSPIRPNDSWPNQGNIELEGLSLRYDESFVLKNIHCNIKPGEKIGVVGRTGAGKSSLLTALFRLATTEGNIRIDGVDTSQLSLKQLREGISIIPQDPVLFIGSLRENLDPFHQYPDEAVWRVLEQVELKSTVSHMDRGLCSQIQEGGCNLSLGERQLVCLARALLRKSKILAIDEATANVDLQTDALIQDTIRSCFTDSTVITTAHRINTIMDCDRVMVLDNGCLVEMDFPQTLLSDPDSVFSKMVLRKVNNETSVCTCIKLVRNYQR